MDTLASTRSSRLVAEVMVSAHPSLRGLIAASPRPEAFEGIRVAARAPLAEAARLMLETGSWMLLVVDDDARLVGMVLREQFTRPGRRHVRREDRAEGGHPRRRLSPRTTTPFPRPAS